jgi:hypothetical protein
MPALAGVALRYPEKTFYLGQVFKGCSPVVSAVSQQISQNLMPTTEAIEFVEAGRIV